MEIFDRFIQIVAYSVNPVIFEFGTCDGSDVLLKNESFS
jgi:hypothetical protein